MRERYDVIDGFFPRAAELRAGFDEHFADPARHDGRHHVWNYWFVPGLYTYLRAMPERIIEPTLVENFVAHLRHVAFERYGLGQVTHPYISCYVAGCVQALHNDAVGGRLGYVFSLTDWEGRNFSGGETLLFREQGYFGSAAMTRPAAGENFYELVPPLFNRLLVFDDRIPHAVPRIEGGMDPRLGRVVLHGHLREDGARLEGPLPGNLVEGTLRAGVQAMGALLENAAASAHGLLTLRLEIAAEGHVVTTTRLLDRLMPIGAADIGDLSERIAAGIGALTFPPANGPSRLTLPILIARDPPTLA